MDVMNVLLPLRFMVDISYMDLYSHAFGSDSSAKCFNISYLQTEGSKVGKTMLSDFCGQRVRNW
jgi:hypothetical protein